MPKSHTLSVPFQAFWIQISCSFQKYPYVLSTYVYLAKESHSPHIYYMYIIYVRYVSYICTYIHIYYVRYIMCMLIYKTYIYIPVILIYKQKHLFILIYYQTVIDKIIAIQRCTCPHPQNFWICNLVWQNRLCRCDRAKNLEIRRLPWITQVSPM